MIPKKIIFLAVVMVLLTACSYSGTSQETISVTKDHLLSETSEKELSLNTETAMVQKQEVESADKTTVAAEMNESTDVSSDMKSGCELKKLGYNPIEKETGKTGKLDWGEMGLYWDRNIIQEFFYPDVQEICEEAFGDYLSPLQAVIEILRPFDKQYRTDKQTANVSSGRCEFYLFLQPGIALVSIEDCGETYHTTFRILREEEAEGIRVLEIPPFGGIGIAGKEHKPEIPNYDTHIAVTDGRDAVYSKADIQHVFDSNLQRITEEIFSDYVQALQGLYMLAEQEGYGDYSFVIQDITTYLQDGDFETTVIGDNYCEFTLLLAVPDRARVTIKKEGTQYITTFRLLKDGEFPIKIKAG